MNPVTQEYLRILDELKWRQRGHIMLAIILTAVICVSAMTYIKPVSVAPKIETCNLNLSTELLALTPASDADMQYLSSRVEMKRRPGLVCCPNEVCLENTPGRRPVDMWFYNKGEVK